MQNLVEFAGDVNASGSAEIQKRYLTQIITLKFLPTLQAWVDQKNLPDEDATVRAML